MKNNGFTLAETLITLMAIGVVAALTIPALMQQIGDYTLKKQKDVFEKKFAEGLRQMRIDGKLAQQYDSTMSFAKEMQKYFKVQALCDSGNIAGCFTQKFNASTSDGTASKDFEAQKMTTAKYLSTNLDDYYDPVGMKLSDGTSMVIVYKKDCTGIAEGDTTGNHTKCIGYIYDVNNAKAPNKLSGDVISNLPLIYPYNLSFELLNNKVYHRGDCETAPDGNEVCYEGDIEQFCEAIGGTVPTFEQMHQAQATVYDEEIIDMFNARNFDNIPESIQINNRPFLGLIGASSGKMIFLDIGGYSFYFFDSVEDGFKFLYGETLEQDTVSLCTTKK